MGAEGKAQPRLRSLAKAQRQHLCEQWRTLYRCDPPEKIPSCWLRMAVAFRLQERAHGTLKPSLRRQLEQYGSAPGEPFDSAPKKVAAGTVLVREWQGVS